MSTVKKSERVAPEVILETYERNAGNVRATAKELGIGRWTVLRNVRKQGKGKEKPIAAGSLKGVEAEPVALPKAGQVNRYILTSAQNNTYVNDAVWTNILALAKFYKAEILVGTYTYNQNAYGPRDVKRGKAKTKEDLWYDPKLKDYFADSRRELAQGLVWCGEYNALPTAVNPLAGLEAYSGRKSAIFPHAKMAMRSIATMQDAGTKLNFTTGTVTQKNYIQKRAGTIAEFHHVYGAVLVEVNENGNWWVRQLNADTDTGEIQDLDVLVQNGEVSVGHRVESITWGDLHSTFADENVVEVSLEMLDALQPKYQFMHDVLEGSSISPHMRDNPHVKFWVWLRGLHRVEEEFKRTAALMDRYDRPFTQTVVVDSNHDNPWIQRWLREYDYRKDPANTRFFLKAQEYMYAQIEEQKKLPRDINMTAWGLKRSGLTMDPKFLIADESFLICNDKIECGMHGHLGPGGRFGSPENLSKMGRRSNIAHTHHAGIYDGLYMAGTSSKLRWDYNKGPSNWTHSHIVTYPNGKRTIITIYAGAWRA